MRINNFTQYGERANHHYHLKLTKQQKERLVALSRAAGFNHLPAYLRFMLLNPSFDKKLNIFRKKLFKQQKNRLLK